MIRGPHVLTILITGIGASQLPLIGTLHVDLAFVASILAGLWGALREARIQRRFLFKPTLSYDRRLIRDSLLLSFFAGVILIFDLWRGVLFLGGAFILDIGPLLKPISRKYNRSFYLCKRVCISNRNCWLMDSRDWGWQLVDYFF